MPKLTKYRGLLLLFLLTIGCYSCGESDPHAIEDIDKEGKSQQVLRLDDAVFQCDYANLEQTLNQFKSQFGPFYCTYVEEILRVGPCDSLSTLSQLKGFATHPDFYALNQEVHNGFTQSRLDSLRDKILEVNLRMEQIFPGYKSSTLVWMNSGFNVSAYSNDGYTAVGLEFFLGTNNSFTRSVPFAQYQKDDMNLNQLVPSAAKSMVYFQLNKMDTSAVDVDFLTNMVFHGKAYYLTKLALGEIADSTLLAWTSDQMNWVEGNGLNCWKEVAQQDVMFSKNRIEIQKWFDVGPFTSARNIPQESPPQLGIYLGYKMVQQYMMKHPEVSTTQLIRTSNNQSILQSYKPDF